MGEGCEDEGVAGRERKEFRWDRSTSSSSRQNKRECGSDETRMYFGKFQSQRVEG